MIEFVRMFERKVLYYNFKTVHLNKENTTIDDKKNMSIFQNNSPLFVVYEDKILFGSVQSLVLPKLKKDSLVLNHSTFIDDFKENISSYKNYKSIFPAQVIGIAFDPNWKQQINYNEKIKLMSEIFNLIEQENKKLDSSTGKPAVVFVDTLSL